MTLIGKNRTTGRVNRAVLELSSNPNDTGVYMKIDGGKKFDTFDKREVIAILKNAGFTAENFREPPLQEQGEALKPGTLFRVEYDAYKGQPTSVLRTETGFMWAADGRNFNFILGETGTITILYPKED